MRHAMTSLLLLLTLPANAQADYEYMMEIGAGAGVVTYLGDFNGSLTKGARSMASIVARRIFSPWTGIKLAASYANLKVSSGDSNTYYTQWQDKAYEFSSTVGSLAATFEYNFWPYGTGRDYRGARRLTPYISGGLGMVYAKCGDENSFALEMPLGLGIKYKAAPRLNIGLEWAIHFTQSDKIDGQDDPLGIDSSGLFKNTDCYTALQLTLTYSFMAKCRTCHNADE